LTNLDLARSGRRHTTRRRPASVSSAFASALKHRSGDRTATSGRHCNETRCARPDRRRDAAATHRGRVKSAGLPCAPLAGAVFPTCIAFAPSRYISPPRADTSSSQIHANLQKRRAGRTESRPARTDAIPVGFNVSRTGRRQRPAPHVSTARAAGGISTRRCPSTASSSVRANSDCGFAP
jgi:hypothetical protein